MTHKQYCFYSYFSTQHKKDIFFDDFSYLKNKATAHLKNNTKHPYSTVSIYQPKEFILRIFFHLKYFHSCLQIVHVMDFILLF